LLAETGRLAAARGGKEEAAKSAATPPTPIPHFILPSRRRSNFIDIGCLLILIEAFTLPTLFCSGGVDSACFGSSFNA